ncbi:hypothetical protein Fcan01_15589 [Folsomia candida]|uniref:Uncharacterized protein n=1 Tax=Folsomia candida TaxID=158441 RepID=A0A226DZM3_FOLCA|nr:hypothetical protein Fcan01_15589 [Folsomia candida]
MGQEDNQFASLRLRFAITAQFRYCEVGGDVNTETLRFWAWVTPLKFSVWMTLLFILMASSFGIGATENGVNQSVMFFLGPAKVLSNLFTVVAIYFRQTCGEATKLKWVIHMGMIVILSVYETYFTSMVVVPLRVERNPSFVSLLKTGYKIAFSRMSTNSSVDISQDAYLDRFNHDFEKLGIAGWIRNATYFHENRNGAHPDEFLSNRTLKVMTDMVVEPIDKKRALVLQEKDNSATNIKCRFAPEIFLEKHSYELAYVSVRVEVLYLLEAIREFGFLEIWNSNFDNVAMDRDRRRNSSAEAAVEFYMLSRQHWNPRCGRVAACS